jgi:WD40 repeat protein
VVNRPHKDVSADDVARSLLTGAWQAPPAGVKVEEVRGGPCAAHVAGSPPAGTPSETSVLSGSSVALPGQVPDTGAKQQTYWQSVARIGIQVGEALAYAHGQGILHRDIKPSNLLLDAAGTVWVTDFGLAKAPDSGDLTAAGEVVGTLRYIPPERFRGCSDARGDVYSLGLTLYELLTLRPAFGDRDRHGVIERILHEEPPRPRQFDPSVPRDLETIILKTIDKDPERRYPSAAALVEDLKRFVEDRPIKARRTSTAERLGRWCRRNPLPAAMSALILLLTLGGVGGIIWQWQKAERAREDATAKAEAERQARRARELMLTDMYTSFGLAAGGRDNPRQAVLWFAHAARLAGDDQERADANRIRAASWGRLAVQPFRALVHPAEWIENNMAFHPGGRHLLTHGYHPSTDDTDCRLWDLERESALPFPGNPSVVSSAVWDATGERLAVGTVHGEVTIYRFPGGEPLQRVPLAGRIARVLYSPNGRYCAVAAANRARVWDCQRGAFATPELKHPAPVTTLAFHPQGELLATGCADYTCRVFAVPGEDDTPLFRPVPHDQVWDRTFGQSPLPPLFLDEGRGLLTVSRGEVSWRDPRTGQDARVLPFDEPGLEKAVYTITLSTDGKHVSLAGGSSSGRPYVRIYGVESAQSVSPNLGRRALWHVLSTAFSPDGHTLLTGGGDHTARLLSVPGGKPMSGPLTHPTSVSSVAFAPDGRHLVTAQRGGLIRLWTLPAGNPRDYRVPVGGQSFIRLSRDGRFLLPTGLSRSSCTLQNTQVIDLTTGQRAGPSLAANGFLLDAAFSPDGLQVAAAVSCAASAQERDTRPGQQPGQLLLWDWRTGKLQHEPFMLPSEPRQLDYSPDGRQLAVIGANGELVVIDPSAGTTLRKWQAHPPHLVNYRYVNNGAVRFGPDNRSLLTFGTDTKVRVWDAFTGQLRYEREHKGKCHDLQFSLDGRLVATAGWDNHVGVWELSTGRQLVSLAHPDWVHTAVFSPDGRHLLTACRDGMARLWDWRAGHLVCPPFEHEHEVHAVAFTPDGRHVLSASDDGVLKIWEWRTGKPVCPPLALGGAGLSLAVTPDGRRVACGGFLKELPVFHLDWLAPPALGPDDLCLWGEIVSGQRIEDGGGVTNLTAEEWLQRWREFRARHPEGTAAAQSRR